MFSKEIQKQDINFYKVYKQKQKANYQVDRFTTLAVVGVAASLIAVSSSYVVVSIKDAKLSEQITLIEEYIEQPEIIEKVQWIKGELNQISNIEQYTNGLRKASSKLDTQPIFDRVIFKEIEKSMPKDVKISQINYSQGTISLTCQATNRLSPANMANWLRESNYIQDVGYTGYSVGDEGVMSYQLTLRLKGEGEFYAAE